ncbi:AAA family ATPase [Chryseobacterium ginsengisoli]|uniref:AAA family ATPase n=1 Tax=Chryseobacterium ginsengisoli TaxID=363853 RepID=A0ABP9MVF8_9FLAO
MKTKITLSGEVASGKSTVGKLLAEQLGYEFISLGNSIRKRAEREGLSIVEFQRKCTKNPELDKEIDREFSNDCNKKDNLIIDYRLGFKFINDAFHVFLKISEKDAIERLKKADRSNETSDTVSERNDAFKKQFENAYGIDYTLDSHYDLIINIDNKMTTQEIINIILTNLKIKK